MTELKNKIFRLELINKSGNPEKDAEKILKYLNQEGLDTGFIAFHNNKVFDMFGKDVTNIPVIKDLKGKINIKPIHSNTFEYLENKRQFTKLKEAIEKSENNVKNKTKLKI